MQQQSHYHQATTLAPCSSTASFAELVKADGILECTQVRRTGAAHRLTAICAVVVACLMLLSNRCSGCWPALLSSSRRTAFWSARRWG
jgi:hypothetical protein